MKKLLFILLFSALSIAPIAPAWASSAYDADHATDSDMHTMSGGNMHADTMPKSMAEDMEKDHTCCEENGACINHDCHSGGRCNTHGATHEASVAAYPHASKSLNNIHNLKTAYTTHIATIAPPPKPKA